MNERHGSKERFSHPRKWGTETQKKRDSRVQRQKEADRRASVIERTESRTECLVHSSILCKTLHANGAGVVSTSQKGKETSKLART